MYNLQFFQCLLGFVCKGGCLCYLVIVFDMIFEFEMVVYLSDFGCGLFSDLIEVVEIYFVQQIFQFGINVVDLFKIVCVVVMWVGQSFRLFFFDCRCISNCWFGICFGCGCFFGCSGFFGSRFCGWFVFFLGQLWCQNWYFGVVDLFNGVVNVNGQLN